MYYRSHICVNTTAPASNYVGGESKVWVENKYFNKSNEDFDHKFTFEQATNPNNKPDAKCVLDGSYVYIKSRTGFYHPTPCDDTHCVAVIKDQSLRQVFRVTLRKYPTTKNKIMRLEISNNCEYLEQNRYLYSSETLTNASSMKMIEHRDTWKLQCFFVCGTKLAYGKQYYQDQ